MATYDQLKGDAINAYLQGGGTQANVDAYFTANPAPNFDRLAADAANWYGSEPAARDDVKEYLGLQRSSPSAADLLQASRSGRGSLHNALMDTGSEHKNAVLNKSPSSNDWASLDAESMARTGGQWMASWGDQLNATPVWKNGTGPAPGASGSPTSGTLGSGAGAGGGYGALGSGGGYGTLGSGSGGGSYALPEASAAAQALRDLQMGATRGLQGLLSRDTTAERKAMEKALYKGQKQGINTAADRARAQMLEGTFGRGVGSSSILVELAGRGQQEHADALARARREAYTQAGAEERADLASALGLFNTTGSLATTGLQGEANVMLANLAREQQESQFSRNLGFQGSENAANRAQAASQFGQNLGLQNAQLAQQGSQFGQNLAFQGSENAANRALQGSQFDANLQFLGGENAANRALTTDQAALNRQMTEQMARMGYDFTGAQNQATRDLQTYLAQTGQTFSAEQNAATRDLQRYLADTGQTFAGQQNQAARDQQRYLAETGQTFTGQQNQATRDQAMQILLLQLAQQQGIADDNRMAAGIGTGITGIGAILNPFIKQYLQGLGED